MPGTGQADPEPPSHTPRPFSGADNTAAVHTQHLGFNRQEQDVFFLPILVVDSGPPTLSSTGTLTIRICGCDSSGAIQSCNTTAFVMAASLSPGALIALLVCVLILVGESTQSRPPPRRPPAWGPGFPPLGDPGGPPCPSPHKGGWLGRSPSSTMKFPGQVFSVRGSPTATPDGAKPA